MKTSFYVLSLALLISGCGMAPNPNLTVSSESYQLPQTVSADPSSNGGHPEQTNYTCPAQANVKPKVGSSYSADLSNTYQVCASTVTASDILVYGKPYQADSSQGVPKVCLYPVDVVDSTHAYPKLDQGGKAMSICVSYDPAGMKFSFVSTNYNAAMIVSEADQPNMNWCLQQAGFNLQTANLGSCPTFASGKFR
ncbi:hypothetical protein WDW37_11500 [Bdellovibrionota bacterium FG-1]